MRKDWRVTSLAASAALAMIAGLSFAAATPAVAEVTSAFEQDIAWLKAHGIASGYADGTFRPTATTSRAAMAAFLYRMYNPGKTNAPAPAEAPFTDVPVTAPFAGDIAWLKDQHITTGFANGTFHPDEPVTRMAAAAFLYRAQNPGKTNAPQPAAPPFLDIPMGFWFTGDIAWLKDEGISTGYTTKDGPLFWPGAWLTREAAAAFLHRTAASLQ